MTADAPALPHGRAGVVATAGPRPDRRRARERLLLAGLLGPSVLLIGVFVVAPVAYALYLSLTNTTLTGLAARDRRFVGGANFANLLSSTDFLAALGRTGQFILFSAIIGQTVLGMAAALLLRRPWMRGRGLLGAAVLLPMVVPEVVASLTWASMLASGPEGTVNRLVALLGVEPVEWLQTYPMLSIVVVNTWRGIAFAMIIFQSALEDVPDDLIEAARIDGAGAVAVFRYVVLPLIRGPLFLYLLLTTITTAGVFGLVYFLTQGGPGSSTQLVAIFVYERAFAWSQIGLGSAASVILLVLVLALGLTWVRLSRVEV